MKLPFLLASASVMLGSTYLVSAQANTVTDPVTEVSSVKSATDKSRPEEADRLRSDTRGETGDAPKRQAVNAPDYQISQRAKSFFLFLQILRSAK